METSNDIELHDLETIEDALNTDGTSEEQRGGFEVSSASGFLVSSASGFLVS